MAAVKPGRLALASLLSAITIVFLLLGYFPYLTYSIPAIAGLFIAVVDIECGKKYALSAFVISTGISFLLQSAVIQPVLLFAMFFGYYPFIKRYIDRIKFKPLAYFIKLIIFNAAIISAYFLLIHLFKMPDVIDEFKNFGVYGAYITLALGNVAVLLYDRLLGQLFLIYMHRFHAGFSKMIKK